MWLYNQLEYKGQYTLNEVKDKRESQTDHNGSP
jgi:hypothetical protein